MLFRSCEAISRDFITGLVSSISQHLDRKSVVQGKSVRPGVDLAGCRNNIKKTQLTTYFSSPYLHHTMSPPTPSSSHFYHRLFPPPPPSHSSLHPPPHSPTLSLPMLSLLLPIPPLSLLSHSPPPTPSFPTILHLPLHLPLDSALPYSSHTSLTIHYYIFFF